MKNNKRWNLLFVLLTLIFNFQVQALMKDNSSKSLKVPRQAIYPLTENQTELFDSPFWYFKNNYNIPILSFNEIDYFILNINQIVDRISSSRNEYHQFAESFDLSVNKCLNYDNSIHTTIRCWYDISYKDIEKLVSQNITAHDRKAKQVYDLFMYREKLSFKLLSMMLKFDNNTSLSLVKDINDYYGMSSKNNKYFIDYIMSSIFEKTYYRYKNSYNENHIEINRWLNRIKIYSNANIVSEVRLLNIVNNMFSNVSYQSDELTWGVEDYHATPFEMLVKGAGDCEDFAYAKMITLLSLGFNLEDMNLKYVTVNSGGKPMAHMVLVVHSKQGSYVLDNLKKNIYLLKDSSFIDSKYEYDLVKLKVYDEDPYQNYTMIGNSDQFTSWRNKFLGMSY